MVPGQRCEPIQSAAVNVRKRLFICQCGVAGRIDKFIASGGDETDDPDEAVAAVVELENGWWDSIVLADFEPGATN